MIMFIIRFDYLFILFNCIASKIGIFMESY